MAQDGTTETVGTRIARARKRRGLTQHGLAQRASYSRGHIAQVEAGQKVATPAFVAAVAAALKVDAADLYGQPYRLPGHDDRVHAFIPELRRIQAFVDVGPELAGPPRSIEVLAAEVATARKLTAMAQLSKMGARLPAVVEELAYWAHETDDPRVWRLLSMALRSAVSLARRLGYTGDALALLGCAMDTGRRSGDPNLPALVALIRALVLISLNQQELALVLLDRAAASVDPARPDAAEIGGALDLRAAIVAARAGQHTRSWDYYGQAMERVRAGRTGQVVHHLEFTAANVAIHGAAVAAELGELDEAARRDREVGERTLTALPPERRAHHEIDMSRVHVEAGDHAKALERLASADRIAPQMVTFHPTARSVVAHLVDVRRTLPEPLRRIQHRMAV
ncbi:XRE family transcriptional regulator [Actinomadura logoneensis]|uniref:XRE family transcriptional regulator n=1 Tax=Actinomadura logoneensis TaxID=2293572 RepID=A0A372JK24_9ACTN|nr:helix-turn-helix transcriptional regulator [Actinomadura logoneensis]RFU39668.1 XRE family transcriptional regulator [Actinomadura logoneensis]